LVAIAGVNSTRSGVEFRTIKKRKLAGGHAAGLGQIRRILPDDFQQARAAALFGGVWAGFIWFCGFESCRFGWLKRFF
jgi:hypothetical protein